MLQIKKYREKRKLTQKDLASNLGVDQSAVSLWESGKTAPRAALLPKIAQICNCTVDELLAPSDEEMNSPPSYY